MFRRFNGDMINGYPRALTLVAAIGAGLAAGVFFAFSTIVMKALRRLPAPQGMRAMQAINKAAPAPLFMTALFGTAVVCVALAVVAIARLGKPPAALLLVGSLLFLAGIVLTVTYHVPHNEALALVDPNDPAAAGQWTRYVVAWTGWNHLRTLTSLAGAITLTIALRAG